MMSSRWANFPKYLSAGGQELHPCEVNSSTTVGDLPPAAAVPNAAIDPNARAAATRPVCRIPCMVQPIYAASGTKTNHSSVRNRIPVERRSPAPAPLSGGGLHEIPEHVLQDPAVPVVLDLVEGIDPAG